MKAGFAHQGIWHPFNLDGFAELPEALEISERHCCTVTVYRLERDLKNSTNELAVYEVVSREDR